MKKSPRLEVLHQCNSQLRKSTWVNYLRFLDVLLESIDHDAARTLLSLKREKRYDDMLKFADRLSSTVFQTAAEHRLCNQLSLCIRKYPFPDGVLSTQPRKAALETFLKSERKCSRVNRRFKLFDSLRSPHSSSLSLARNWIRYVLGDHPDHLDIAEACDFGPGSSLGIHGNATNFARKLLAQEWSVSPGAFYYAQAFMKNDIHIWELLTRQQPESRFFNMDLDAFNKAFASKARIVNYNKIAFVPKTAKTERTIAVEPLCNGYIQKGIDVVMRKKLRRVGIDLEDQTLNQGLAKFGSIPGLDSDPYVTIDLSSASDSISIELCRHILPPDWFDLLNSVRSSSYMIEGEIHPYEKFTTMGNGFCFPLETLIFASLCHTACTEMRSPVDFSVYGDDIIVRHSVANRVLKLLSICGFKANLDKTFLEGPFRESCGADWFKGEDVRPVTLDYCFDSVQSIFKFCNLARRKDWTSNLFCQASEFLTSLVPKALMFTRPYPGNVDSALEVELDVFLSSRFSRYSRKTQAWSWLELETVAFLDYEVCKRRGYDVAVTRGALTGSSSRAPFAVRRKTRTKIRRISHGGGWSLYLPGVLFSRGNQDPFTV